MSLVKRVSQSGITVIMTTYFPNHAFAYADRVALGGWANQIGNDRAQSVCCLFGAVSWQKGKRLWWDGGFIPDVFSGKGVSLIRTTAIRDAELMFDLLENCAGAVERFFPLVSENMIIVKG